MYKLTLILINVITVVCCGIAGLYVFDVGKKVDENNAKVHQTENRENVVVEPSKDTNTNKSYVVVNVKKDDFKVDNFKNFKYTSDTNVTVTLDGKQKNISLIGIELSNDVALYKQAQEIIQDAFADKNSYLAIYYLKVKKQESSIHSVSYSLNKSNEMQAYLFDGTDTDSTTIQSKLVMKGLAKVNIKTIPTALLDDKLAETLLESENIAKGLKQGIWAEK